MKTTLLSNYRFSRQTNSRAFSLVLALVVTSMLLLLVITLVAFISIDLVITASTAERQRARFNALASLRIAVAHIQQEAGADQRVTAQANVSLPVRNTDSADAARNLWQNKHPYWTGVWDTSDDARPPSWLVSGQFQLRSLFGKTAYENDAYKTPWTAVANPNISEYVTLFSRLPTAVDNSTDHPFDTRVIAPLIEVFSADKSLAGHFGYWVADEGVKGRLNVRDNFERKDADSAFSHARVLVPPRAAAELFPRWDVLKTDDKLHPGYVVDTPGYANLPKLSHIGSGLNNFNPANTYSHAITAYSQGVLADVRHGGLKHDLSLLFELPATTFHDRTVYGIGRNSSTAHNNGTGTLNMTGTVGHDGGDGSVKDLKWDYNLEPMTLVDNKKTVLSRPVFNVAFGGFNIRGPAWELMRNYYRLYKDGDDDMSEQPGWPNFVDGALRARTFYPGILAHRNFNGEAISHIFNSQNAGGDDVYAKDTWRGGSPIPRVTKVAAPAYMARYILGFGLQQTSDGTLRLILIPIVGIRNPFNVPLRLVGNGVSTENKSGKVAIRISLRRYASTTFTFTAGSTTTPTVSMETLFDRQGVGYGGGGSLAIYVPADITIPPGETWIFSPSDRETVQLTKSLIAERGFNQRGGFYLDKLNNGQPLKIDESGTVDVKIGYNPSGDSYNSGTFIREQISCWPGDNHVPSGSVDDNCSEHSEPFMIQFNAEVSFTGTPEAPPERLFSVSYPTGNIPETGSIPIGITEFLEKPAGPEVPNNFPLYAMSNPLTSTKRPDAQVRWGARGDQYGFKSTTPSWHFRIRKATSWEELLEVSGYSAFGGNSITSGGQTKFISAHIPRAPMLTLGQFQSACLSVADHQPLYSVGHSFASPFVKPNSIYYTANNWTRYDHTWLLNAALWDRFYFSSIAPEVDPSGSGLPTVKRDQQKVWSDFLNEKEPQPLLNQQFVLNSASDKAAAKRLLEENHSYRKSAAYLLQNGTFNINSTDERAWRTVLGSTHETPVPTMNNNSGVWSGVEKTNDSPFPRLVPIVGSNGNGGLKSNNGIADAASWKGGKALNNGQIEKLARAIIVKIRNRFASNNYKAKYSGPAGETLCRPFFSLAEFINRELVNDEAGKIGLIQSAIFHADSKLGAAINTGMKQAHDLTQASLRNAKVGAFYAPEIAEISDGNILMASAAPGALLQGDILQAIGSKISPRSDTFLIRAYGDTTAKAGIRPIARAYIEAVVQRTPDYMDPSDKNAPDVHPDKDTWDPEGRKINSVNRYFGRRFTIVSVRWLAENEI